VTEFAAGITAGAQPIGIVSGPDGNLWFTEGTNNGIGRITTGGVVTEFTAGMTAGSIPRSIVAGPDGNLWFTENGGNRVGRITTAGVITEFGGLSAGSTLITRGPDGNLWFTERTASAVGSITTGGAVTEYTAGITAASGPFGIAAGPDGNIWFAENAANHVGRVLFERPPTVTGPTATDVTSTSATVGAGVNPLGLPTTYHFEYGPTTAYGSSTSEQPASSGSSEAPVTATLTALVPATTYHFRVVATNSAGSATSGDGTFTTAPGATVAAAALPPPVFGKRANLTPQGGSVLIKLPGSKTFVPLAAAEQVPFGTVVDTTRGQIQLCTATPSGQVQCAVFYGGRFKIVQQAAVTVLVLVGGDFSRCPAVRGHGAAIAGKGVGLHSSIRHLWANGSGQFRTQGRYASATVRGTRWLTDDRCDGTLIRVAAGAVAVRDLRRHRTIALRAPRTYLARARR